MGKQETDENESEREREGGKKCYNKTDISRTDVKSIL